MANKVSLAGGLINLNGFPFAASIVLDGDQIVQFVWGTAPMMSQFSCQGCPELYGVNIDAATALGIFSCENSPAQVVVVKDCPELNFLRVGGAQIYDLDASGCGVVESEIDNILAALDASGLESGTVDLSGGTNAPPSAAGLTSKSNLEGKGWTVTVNS